jgi:hypothetical protein
VYDGYSNLDVAGTDGYDDTSYDAGYEQGQVCGNNTCDEGVWDQILAAKNAEDNTIMYDFGDDSGEVTFAIYEYQEDGGGLSYEYVERSYIKTDIGGNYTTGNDYASYTAGYTQGQTDYTCSNDECPDSCDTCCDSEGACYSPNCDSGTEVCCGNNDCPDSGFIDMGCLIEDVCSENPLLTQAECEGLGGTWTSECSNTYDNTSYTAGYSAGYSIGVIAGDEAIDTVLDYEFLETKLKEISENGNGYDLQYVDCWDDEDPADGTPECGDGTNDYVVYEYIPGWSYNAGTNTDCGCGDVGGEQCNCPDVLDCCGDDLCENYIDCGEGGSCDTCGEAGCDTCGEAGCDTCGEAGCYSANCDDPSLCGDGTCPDSFLGFAPDFIKGSGSDTGLLKQQYFAFTLPAKCGDRFGLSDCTSEQLVCAGDPGYDGDCSEEFAECGEHGVCAQYETDRIMKASVFLNKDDDNTTNRFTVNNDYIYVNYADDNTQEFKKYFIYYSDASVLQWSSNYSEDAWFNGDGNNDLEPGRGYFIVAHNDYWLKWRDV